MVNLLTAASALAMTLTMAGAAQTPPSGPATQLTVVGCVARNGAVDPDKGTRILDIPPNALALTGARILAGGTGASSAVPGSPPDARDSGTIPNAAITGAPRAASDTLSFELVGASASKLSDQVGRRVEVVGRAVAADPDRGDQARGTSGTGTGAREGTTGNAPTTGNTTREGRPDQATAHPSAEFRRLEVITFRSVAGMCE